jgi:hypothetical protein
MKKLLSIKLTFTILFLLFLCGQGLCAQADRYVRITALGALETNPSTCAGGTGWTGNWAARFGDTDLDAILGHVNGVGESNTLYLCSSDYTGSAGTFHEAMVIPLSSFNIEGVGTTKPILSGAIELGAWTDVEANSEYYIAVPTDIGGGNEIYNLLRNGAPVDRDDNDSENGDGGDLAKGHWCLDTDNTRIYYRLADGETSDIFTNDTWESAAGTIISAAGYDSVSVKNIEFYGGRFQIDTGAAANADSWAIQGNDFVGAGTFAIYVERGDGWIIGEDLGGEVSSTNYSNKFSYNHGSIVLGVSDLSPDASEDSDNSVIQYGWLYRNGYNYDEQNDGDHDIDVVPYSDTNTIKRNLFQEWAYFGGQQFTASTTKGSAVSFDGAQNITLTLNRFKDNYQGCVAFGKDSNAKRIGTGTLISFNIFDSNAKGSWDASSGIGSSIVRNTAPDDGVVDFEAIIANNSFIGNTYDGSVSPDAGAACIYLGSGVVNVSGITVVNNIFYENDNRCDLRLYTHTDLAPTTVTLTENNNLYYRSDGSSYAVAGGNWGQTNRARYPTDATFSVFTEGTGVGFTSITRTGGTSDINTDSLFVSATDFNLKPGSPCRNAGTPNGSTPYTSAVQDLNGRTITDASGDALFGTALDIGAYEYFDDTDYVITEWYPQKSGKGIYELTINVTTDSNGSIPATLLSEKLKGKHLLQVDAYPTPGGTAPDPADLVLYDENGVYYLAGNGVNLIHPTIPKSCIPDMNSTVNRYWPVRGNLYFDILNQTTSNANITLDFVFTD